MTNLGIILTFGAALCLTLVWAFRTLPREDWQMLASLPVEKAPDGSWLGVNLTYYGFFTANAHLAALAVFFTLLGSVGVSGQVALAAATALLLLCVPASRWIARLVEGKRHTFTVGGASFLGILAAPWIGLILEGVLGAFWGLNLPLWPFLAALAISYAVGEGLGRLACISFGCCYGRPMHLSPPWIRRVLRNRAFTFQGQTRKVAYSGGLAGEALVPVQALTSILYLFTALLSMQLFSLSLFPAAFVTIVGVTQWWRFFSEFLRADYRGHTSLTAYQVMAALAPLYSAFMLFLLPLPESMQPDLLRGLHSLWTPWIILFFQTVWLTIFFYTGRSRVTSSLLSFKVLEDRI